MHNPIVVQHKWRTPHGASIAIGRSGEAVTLCAPLCLIPGKGVREVDDVRVF